MTIVTDYTLAGNTYNDYGDGKFKVHYQISKCTKGVQSEVCNTELKKQSMKIKRRVYEIFFTTLVDMVLKSDSLCPKTTLNGT